MKIYSNLVTAGLAWFGCASALAYKISNALVPIQFMHGCQYKDVLMGLIYSKIDYVGEPLGESRDLLDAQMYCLASYCQPIDEHKNIPVFERQHEIITAQGLNSRIIQGSNEFMLRGAFSGIAPKLDTVFDVINIQHTLDTFHSVATYDLSKISSNRIYYRSGFVHEWCEINGRRESLRNVPVLSDQKNAFGSPFCDFNAACVDQDTKEIITFMFGFGASVNHIESFSNNLRVLQKAQEEQAKTTTVRMQVLSGYPALYDLDCLQTPTIVCGY